MHIALFGLNMPPTTAPADLVATACTAEDLGYESVWVGEHPILPHPPRGPMMMDATTPILDPVVTLTLLAGVTSRLRLATGVLQLPLRNPVVLAKELASLDVLSGGRLTVGFGVGYLPAEFEAVGVQYEDRAERGREYVEALRCLWDDERPAYEGRFVRFSGVEAQPRPAQPHLPLVAGGHSPLGLRRAVTHADGWYGFGLDPEGTGELLARLGKEQAQHPRPERLGPLEISVTPPRGRVGAADLERYRDLGVHRLVVQPPGDLDRAGMQAFLRDQAELIGR